MNPYWLSALLILLLFGISLACPVAAITEASRASPRHVDYLTGLNLLAFGWLGPMQASFAWYANLPLVFCLVQMLRAQPPSFGLTSFTALLAATSLLPFANLSALDGWHMGLVRGPAVWLWLASFCMLFGTALYARR